VKVEPRKEGDAAGSPLERIVTIRGNPDACWKVVCRFVCAICQIEFETTTVVFYALSC
jgi:hypothetical protein